MSFDPLTTNAVDLQHLLDAGKTTSVKIVLDYLAQIEHHNHKLRAFITLAPQDLLLDLASKLDEERRHGRLRGPLHGVPIVLKDSFMTASQLGMETTAGAWALVGAKTDTNSAIAQRLLDQGLIILGKTNMTELAGMKTTMMTPGWSAVGGQTVSPYVGPIAKGETLLGHTNPGGSSTGSAVAVAAGFAPLALGTETIGSIVTPANRAGLYALKPTVGIQNTRGLYTMTDFFDSPGPMAKSAEDILVVTEILLGKSFSRERLGSWEGLKVGFLDPTVWKMTEEMCRPHEGTVEQMKHEYEAAITKLKAFNVAVQSPISIGDIDELTVNGAQAIMPIAFWEFKNVCLPRFLRGFKVCRVRTLAELIIFNDDNKDHCLPPPHTTQDDFLKALDNKDEASHIEELKTGLRAVGRRILDQAFDDHGVNLIVALADCSLCIHAAAAGYPLATVPLGQLRYNDRPFGLCVVAKANEEEVLLRFMHAWSGVLNWRPVPDL